MTLKRLRIDAVRCLTHVDVELDRRRNYLFGANGAGKTSFLEAIYLLGRGRSFRLRQTARLVQRGREELSVFGETEAVNRMRHRLGIAFRSGRLHAQLDGETPGSQAEMLRVLPVHVIDPRLHQLVEAGPSERRRYIDSGVFHVEHRFLSDWRQYRRTLGQRNAALKARVGRDELEAWTESLLVAGNAVHRARRVYLERLGALVHSVGERLVG
ncbi:MAG: DNA replication/repair protein RecF [Gammaproteobacteria bacterium]